MIRKVLNTTGIALALAIALQLLTNAAFAGPNSNGSCFMIYDWATRTWKLHCLPW